MSSSDNCSHAATSPGTDSCKPTILAVSGVDMSTRTFMPQLISDLNTFANKMGMCPMTMDHPGVLNCFATSDDGKTGVCIANPTQATVFTTPYNWMKK